MENGEKILLETQQKGELFHLGMDFRENQGEYPPFHLLKSVVL